MAGLLIALAGVVLALAGPASAAQPGVHADGSGMYGVWTNPATQGRISTRDAITWYEQSPVAPHGGIYNVIFFANADAGQAFDCPRLTVEEGTLSSSGSFVYRSSVTTKANRRCGSAAYAVRLSPIPAGMVARIVIPTTISTAAASRYGAHGVIAMSGRSDLHLLAPTLRRVAVSTAPSSAISSPTSAPTTRATTPATTATPTSTVPSTSAAATSSRAAAVPTGRPVDADHHDATRTLGAGASTGLVAGVAVLVLLIAGGATLLRRRLH